MKIKFLNDCTAPVSVGRECGDVCRCYHVGWETEVFLRGAEVKADIDNNHDGREGIVDIGGLTFNVDYVITQFP